MTGCVSKSISLTPFFLLAEPQFCSPIYWQAMPGTTLSSMSKSWLVWINHSNFSSFANDWFRWYTFGQWDIRENWCKTFRKSSFAFTSRHKKKLPIFCFLKWSHVCVTRVTQQPSCHHGRSQPNVEVAKERDGRNLILDDMNKLPS